MDAPLGTNAVRETDVNEIRNLIEECTKQAHSIRGKAWELHDDAKPDDAKAEKPPSAGIGAEFIEKLVRLRDVLAESFTTLQRFC